MLSNLVTVSEQVLVLFILLGLGFLLGKLKVINEAGAKVIANIVLFAVTPCVIVKAFQSAYDKEMMMQLLVGFAISIGIFLFSILLIELIYRKKKCDRNTVIKFAIVFSNAGYIGLPLQEAVLGENGIFFGASFVAVFNMVLWTYGYFIMSGKKDKSSIVRGFLNPGVLGTAVAITLFVLNISLPKIIYQPVSYLASLNTPLPMMIVGFYLAKSNMRETFCNKDVYITIIFRHLVIPFSVLGILYLIGIRGTLLVSMVIAASAPTAVATTLMSSRYNKDTTLASSIVSASSLVSILTMPVIIALAQTIAGG